MIRLSRLWRSGVLLIAAGLTLTACSSGSEDVSESGVEQGGFPRTVEHALGETEVETPPHTVAALDSSFVDAALALETPVVAYTAYPSSDSLPEYLGSDVEFAQDGQVIGELSSPDVEALWDIQPDLIVSAQVRHESIYNELSNIAPTVFSETTGGTWKDNIRLLAEALGKEELAEQKIGAYEQRAQEIGAAIEEEAGEMPTYSLVRFIDGEPTVRLYTSTSFPGIVLSDVGLKRAPGQPDAEDKIAVDLSQEDIGTLDADQIFVSSYIDTTQDADNPQAAFESNPLWGTLEGRITDVDDETWYVSVSLQGAHAMLDDIAEQFGVDSARE